VIFTLRPRVSRTRRPQNEQYVLATTPARARPAASADTVPHRSADTPIQLAPEPADDPAGRAAADLLAMVSHELLTPLTIISGVADTLAREDMELDPGVQDRLLGHVREESDRLGHLLQQLVTASRLQAGTVHVRARPLRPEQLLRGVARQLGEYTAPLCLVIDIHAPEVLADPELAWDVLYRLVERAASQPGVTSIEAGCRRDPDGVRFWVHDDGPHIPESEHDRAFRRFSTTAGDGPGIQGAIGLRLHICQQLVQLMGGTIRLESGEHSGTTFHVQLPAAVPNRRSPHAFPQPQLHEQDGRHARHDRAQQPA
jgi:signal transduction histidine kinase